MRGRDVTERERAEAVLRESEERQTFILKLSDALRPLHDPEQVKRTATQFLGERLAVNRVFYADAAAGRWLVTRGYETGVDPLPDRPFVMSEYGDWIIKGFRAGTGLVVSDMHADGRFQESERQAHLELQIGAEIALPLVKGGELVAMLVAHNATPREWSDREIALLGEVAERTWAAVERARAEAALRESEAEYRTLFERMGQGYCEVELVRDDADRVVDLRYLAINPAFERHAGIPATVLGRRVREFVPDLEPWWFENYGRIARSGHPERLDQVVEATGRWYEVQAYPRGGDRLALLFDDVTERKRAEHALRESEARQAFLLTLSDALRAEIGVEAIGHRAVQMIAAQLSADRVYLVKLNSDDDRVVVTHETRRADLAPLRGEYWRSTFPIAVREIFERTIVYEDVRTDQRLTELDRASFAGLGAVGLLAASNRRGKEEMGWAAGAMSTRPRAWTSTEIGLFEDAIERTWTAIERARAEAALRESEEQFRRSIEEAAIPMIMHAEDGEVLQISRTWTELTGYTLDEVKTFDAWLTRAYGEGANAVREHVHALFSGSRRTMSMEFPVRTRGGDVRHWSFSASAPGTLRDGRRFVVGMALDVTERRLAEEAADQRRLAATRDELRRSLAAAEEAERRRLARELHDQLGQHLTGFALGLADVRRRLAAGEPTDARLAQLEELARLMTRDARALALELRPPELDDLGLESALQTYVSEWSARFGVAAELAVTGVRDGAVSAEVGSTVYRIAQEALTNVARHAHASQVSVIVEQPASEVRLIVEDDGRGFDVDATAARAKTERRFGLAGIRERAATVGGTVAVESSPGRGTTLFVRLPVDAPR